MSAVSGGVQRAVGEDGIVEEGHSFVPRAVTRDDRGGPPMALDEHIVEIARMLGGELAQAEVVEEEQVRREPAPQFPLEGVIGPGLMERLQELGDGDAADAVAARQALCPRARARKVFPTPTRPQKMTFSWWASQCRLNCSRTRARSGRDRS